MSILIYNVFLLATFLVFGGSASISIPDYNCQATEYYNPIILGCDELVIGYTETEGSMLCSNDYITELVANKEPEFTCTECAESSSEFGSRCVTCPENKVSENGYCNGCDFTKDILVDTSMIGNDVDPTICQPCEAGFRPGFLDVKGVPRKCVKCEYSDCKCEYSAGFCFPTGFDFKTVETHVSPDYDTQTFPSKLLEDNLKGVGALCELKISESLNNITACQVLTNLCVLLHSDIATANTYPTPCSWLWKITEAQFSVQTIHVNNRPGWLTRVPWLFYDYSSGTGRSFQSNDEVIGEEVEQSYTFNRKQDSGFINLQVISYSMDGTAQPIKSVTNELSLCPTPALSFGTTLSSTCTLSVAALQSRETIFHELYLEVPSQDDVTTLEIIPVPVLVTNSNPAETPFDEARLSRRYFLVDNQIGVEHKASEKTEVAHFIRLASTVSLTVTVESHSRGNIMVPLLRVTYTDVKLGDNVLETSTVETSFNVNYDQTSNDLRHNLGIAVGVMAFLALVYAVVQAVGYRRRNNIIEDCSCQTISCFVIFLCGGLGGLFWWILAGTSWYYLCIYKGQEAVHLFLPLDNGPFKGLIVSCFVLILISRLYFLFTSTSYDIFFLDWEKPKGKFIPTTSSTKDEETLTSVSIWRTYFLANEWNELHTTRKIHPTFQYLTFLFFTEYVGFKYLGTSQPDAFVDPSNVDYVSDYNIILRAGIISSIMFVIWVIQRLYTFLYERFICDQIQMYIDLCSISNISVVVLSHEVYGYYIHGRAVHGSADADMAEIVTSLKREEENLCGKRGLGPDSEQQTFDMVVPILLRMNYNRTTLPLRSRDIASNRNQRNDVEKQITAYWHINRLFSSFIEHSLDDIDYSIGDKLFLEKVLDMEVRVPPPGKGILYNDAGQSFEQVLYYGNEWLLFTWDVVLITMLDYSTHNYIFAVLLAWLINEIVIKSFSSWRCQKNVAEKALIDERFLL